MPPSGCIMPPSGCLDLRSMAALWRHNATLWQHNVSFGAHNFHCPSGRGAVISQSKDSIVSKTLVNRLNTDRADRPQSNITLPNIQQELWFREQFNSIPRSLLLEMYNRLGDSCLSPLLSIQTIPIPSDTKWPISSRGQKIIILLLATFPSCSSLGN